MSRLFSIALVLAMGLVFQTGCGDKASVTTEKKVSGPGGTTTTTTEQTIKKTGENPPSP